MNDKTRKIIGILFTLFTLVVLWYIREIVAYVLISIVLTIIFSPLMRIFDSIKIKGHYMPNWIKALLCMLLLYAVVGITINVFTPVLVQEAKELSQVSMDDVSKALSGPIEFIESRAMEWDIRDGDQPINRKYLQNKFVDFFDVKQIPYFFTSLISGLGNFLLAIFSVSFITFFLLKDRYILNNSIDVIVPDAYVNKSKNVVKNASRILQRYFIGLLIQVTVISTFVGVSLSIIGIKNALLIGFFAGVINVIPYLGPAIGASVGILIALTTNIGMYSGGDVLPLVIKIGSVFAIVQLLDNFVFQPLIFSNSIKAHPLEIFLVILIAGSVFGIAGMIIAIPAYSFIRILAGEFFSQFKLVKSMTRSRKV